MYRELVSCADFKPYWRRLVKLFEAVTPPSKGMERQTTPYIAGQTSLHKSFPPRKEKSRIALKITVPWSPINFTPNAYASAAERLCLQIRLFAAFLGGLWWGIRQRLLATWFHCQLWLVHLNLSARWQHDPLPLPPGKRTFCRESNVPLGHPRAIFWHLYS